MSSFRHLPGVDSISLTSEKGELEVAGAGLIYTARCCRSGQEPILGGQFERLAIWSASKNGGREFL